MVELIDVPEKTKEFDPSRLIPVKRKEDRSFDVLPSSDTAFDPERLVPVDTIDPQQPIGKDIPPLTDYLKFKYQKGFLPLVRGSYGREAMWGRMDSQKALEQGNDAYLEQLEKAGKLQDVHFKEAPMMSILGEGAEMLPFMLSSLQEGLKSGLILGGGWAAITAVAGQLGPQLVTPEEIITVPGSFAAGMTTGMAFGVLKNAMDIEGGNLFLDLIEGGIPDKTARPLALGAGLAIGTLELTELALFAAPFKRAFRKMITEGISQGALITAAKQYFKTLGVQVGVEELQEIVSIATEMMAGIIEDNPNVIPDAKEIRERLVQTAIKTSQGLAVLGVPGAAVTAISAQQRIVITKKAVSGEEVTAEDLKKTMVEVEKGLKEREEKVGKKKEEAKKTTKVLEERLIKIKADAKPLVETPVKVITEIGQQLTVLDRFTNNLTKAFNVSKRKFIALTPMDLVFDLMSKSEKPFTGAVFKIFKQTLDIATRKADTQRSKIEDDYFELRDKLKLNESNMDRIGTWGLLQQEKGRERLIKKFNKEVIEKFEEQGLNKNETEMFQFIRKNLDSLKQPILEVMKEAYGKDFRPVKDYFPFAADFEAMEGIEIQNMFGNDAKVFDLLTPETKPIAKDKPQQGFTEKRRGGDLNVKINAEEIFLKYVDNATYLIHLGRDITALQKLAGKQEFRNAVGDIGFDVTKDWLNLMARRGGAEGNRIRSLDWLRKNTGIAILGYKLSTIMIQPTALLDGAALIGNYAFKGAFNITLNKEWRAFVKDNFVEIQKRIADDPAFAQFMRKEAGEGVIGAVKRNAFWGVRKMDGITASSIAAGAYEKIVTEKGEVVDFTKPDQDAIIEAELIVRRSQASGQFKDVPSAVSQGKFTGNVSVDKMIFQFQTFILGRFSLITQAFSRQGFTLKPTQESLNIITYLTLAVFAEVLIRRGVEEILAVLTGDEPDEPLADVLFEKFVFEAITTIPIVSQAVNAVKYKQVPIPVISFAQQGIERAGLVIKTKDDKKKRIQLARAILTLAGLLGVAPGASQVDQLVGKIFKEDKGKKTIKRF